MCAEAHDVRGVEWNMMSYLLERQVMQVVPTPPSALPISTPPSCGTYVSVSTARMVQLRRAYLVALGYG